MTAAGRTPTVTLLGYGSLQSGLGLRGLAPLAAFGAARVRLLNGRRGFAKPSQYGDRLAMALEPLRRDEPLRAAPPDGGGAGTPPVEALAVRISIDDLVRVARREGYPPRAMRRLVERGAAEGTGIASYLWSILVRSGFDLAAYRRRLFALGGATSPHYVPHPVALHDGSAALTFLAPGREGTGSPDVVSVSVAHGPGRLLSLREAWRWRHNDSQLRYFAMCLLAGVHGISLRDVLDGAAADPELRLRLGAVLAAETGHEPARFREALCLGEAAYRLSFALDGQRSRYLDEYFPRPRHPGAVADTASPPSTPP